MINQYRKYFAIQLDFADHVPMLFISAKTRQRVTNVLKLANQLQINRTRVVPQEQLNNILQRLLAKKPKQKQKLMKGQPKKLLILRSLRQSNTNPPTFLLNSPHPKNVAPALINILEQNIRAVADFSGVPIMIDIRNELLL